MRACATDFGWLIGTLHGELASANSRWMSAGKDRRWTRLGRPPRIVVASAAQSDICQTALRKTRVLVAREPFQASIVLLDSPSEQTSLLHAAPAGTFGKPVIRAN